MDSVRHIRLGKKVHELRRSQHLSQRRLAEMIGTSQSTCFNIEHGKSDPKYSTLLRIADALDVDVRELIG